MSVALELWRALEAWDAARHPRGPNGRFIKLGGSGGDRPSLADAVRGTAAAGPKRQRAGKGGMSVADAVRDAARRSDSTGRPQQRSQGEHRAHGAHDVADEVERALADAGVSEDVRRMVAGRARAAADSHGARPDSLQAPSKPSAKVAAAGDEQARRAAAKADIRAAVARLETGPGEWVGIADVRDELGTGHSRADVDEALRSLLDEPGVRIIPVANTKALKPRDHEAAVRIGGEDNHAILIDRSQAPQPAPPAPNVSRGGVDLSKVRGAPRVSKPAAKRAPAKKAAGGGDSLDEARAATAAARRELADALMNAPSRSAARDALSGLNVRELRALAGDMGASVGAKDTKAKLIDRLADIPGRRLDSAAIDRMARPGRPGSPN